MTTATPSAQGALFDRADLLPPGLRAVPAIIDADEERALLTTAEAR